MTALTNWLENELIDHVFRARAFTAPAALWVALHTADPGETGATGEVSGGNYGRAQCSPGFANWLGTGGETTDVDSAGTGGTTSNRVQITFPAPTGANWGVITHVSIWSLVSGGNCVAKGALSTPKTVNDGDPAPYFAVGELTFQIDN